MVTSRTGTAMWKNLRSAVLRDAQRDGVTACPSCHRPLFFGQRRRGEYRPDHAEVDHIVPRELGGRDVRENLRVLCADCNKRRRGRERRVPTLNGRPALRVSRQWGPGTIPSPPSRGS